MRLRGDNAADNPTEDGSAGGIAMVMMMVVMMVLGELYACRRLLRPDRIVGSQRRHRIGDRLEEVAIGCRRGGHCC